MNKVTIEELFKGQLAGPVLTEDSPQIDKKRIDYLGNPFVVGDTVLHVLINRLDEGEVEIVTVTSSGANGLLDETRFQFHNADVMPRFHEIEKCKKTLSAR